MGAPQRAVIGRRHVIYVEGWDPQGAEGYYRLFERSVKRFRANWPLEARLGELQLDSQAFAHWNIETSGPNWRVATRYDFLRQEHFIRANMAEPLRRQVPRALHWIFDYLVTGAMARVVRGAWRFGFVLIYFQLMLIAWIWLAIGAGWLAGFVLERVADVPGSVALLVGVLAALAAFLALRPLADRLRVVQINSHWPHLTKFARGEASCFDAPIEAAAQRLVAVAHEADEIVVVGHSGGGVLAPAIVARALELDPDVGRRAASVVMLTLGSIAPGAALHPKAEWLRAVFARIAVEPSIAWIDVQARKDALAFWNFDPVEGIGVHPGSERRNPIVWRLRFRDMLSPEIYDRIRINLFWMHYQFIMANDRRAPYDYCMLLCGPVPVATWAEDPHGVLAAFAADASLAADRVAARTAGSC